MGKVVAIQRKWKAGQSDIQRSGWGNSQRPVDADIREALAALRSRSREEAQNNAHVRQFLREVKTNVVGHRGVRLQSKAQLASGRADERTRQAVEDAWIEWGEVGSCEMTRRLGWVDVQHQCIETVARDGEAIYRLVESPHNRFRFGLQAHDPATLDVTLTGEAQNGNVIRMGVEVDSFDAPVAYYFVAQDRTQRTYYSSAAGGMHIRVPAEDIIHVYLPEWAMQTRGTPWAAAALRRLHDLEGYDESAVMAARAGASKMGFLKRNEDAPPELNEDGTVRTDYADDETEDGRLLKEFMPGSIDMLPPGVEFQGWDPRFPHAEHGNFTKAILRGIASALGVSYNTLANDAEGVNYSSLRHFALTEREAWKVIQEWMIRTFHQRVYRRWLEHALDLEQLLDATGRPIRRARAAELRRVAWQPRRWSWVDPKNDAETAQLEVEMRVRSLSSVIRERGEDPDEVFAEIQREREMLAEMGISPQEAMAVAIPEPPDDESDDDSEED